MVAVDIKGGTQNEPQVHGFRGSFYLGVFEVIDFGTEPELN